MHESLPHRVKKWNIQDLCLRNDTDLEYIFPFADRFYFWSERFQLGWQNSWMKQMSCVSGCEYDMNINMAYLQAVEWKCYTKFLLKDTIQL